MNKRTRHIIHASLATLFLVLIAFLSSQKPLVFTALAKSISPTPTYDPLAQPSLPPYPTEYELGRYLYWRHCMPCHGDRGQGLTDEFRGAWVEDHQNCWARGCHSGKYAGDSFYVPTVVPALVTSNHLARFPNQLDLLNYLRSTHPPQDPGFLEEDEYRALAFFVFTMNDRSSTESTLTPTITPTPSLPPLSQTSPLPGYVPVISIVSLLLISIFVIVIQKRTEVRAPEK